MAYVKVIAGCCQPGKGLVTKGKILTLTVLAVIIIQNHKDFILHLTDPLGMRGKCLRGLGDFMLAKDGGVEFLYC